MLKGAFLLWYFICVPTQPSCHRGVFVMDLRIFLPVMRTILFLLAFSVFPEAFAQDLGAYTDNRGYFYVFDKGIIKEMEYLPVKSFKAGGSSVAWVSNTNDFKVYYNGEVNKIEEDVPPEDYHVSNYLIAYRYNTKLKVVDKGRMSVLVYFGSSYSVGDSVVAFLDNTMNSFKVYYQGSITELENGLSGAPVNGFIAGGNAVAFIGRDNHFKVFMRNKTTEVENNKPTTYQVGMNTVAYVDGFTQAFKVFYNGTTYTLETTPPKTFSVGNDMVAYTDNMGEFRIFYRGKKLEISSFEPKFFTASGYTVLYGDDRSFNAFWEGESYALETYIPDKYSCSWNSAVWVDMNNKLKMFSLGDVKQVLSLEKINSMELNRNVLLYNIGNNTTQIYYKGKTYY